MPPIKSNRATTPAKTETLIDYAHSRGIRVEWAIELPERGRYIPALNLIVLRHGMTERRTVSTLAHELGHAHYGDWCSVPDAEARAWRYAAKILVSEAELRLAWSLHESAGAVARELGVTQEVINNHPTLRTPQCA